MYLEHCKMPVSYYLVVQEHHHVQVLQEVLGFQAVPGNLGDQDLLYHLEDLGCLDLEARGLLSLHLHQRIL